MTKLIICNWKMNLGAADSLEFMDKIRTDSKIGYRFIVCPPYTSLTLVNDRLKSLKSTWLLGAQDCAAQDNGARTGDVSPQMLKDVGCSYVILGHSERRNYHGERDKEVKEKALKAMQHGLTPIICVGETEEEYTQGKTEEVLKKQIENPVPSKQCVVAYEPVWAIGTGKVPTHEEIETVHQFIDKTLRDLGFSGISIVYGGSVKAENISQILNQPTVSGVLIGGASIKPESMNEIIKELSI